MQYSYLSNVTPVLNKASPNYNPNLLLHPSTVSNELDISEGTLSVWRCTGRYNLPFVKIGRKVRYRVCDVVAFIESRVQQTGGAHHE